jgi:hypothetical protein
MVRAYGDKPVRLLARTHLGGAVELEFEEEGGRPIFFPADDVFQLDEHLFAELATAFDAGRREQLTKSWGKASPFVPA